MRPTGQCVLVALALLVGAEGTRAEKTYHIAGAFGGGHDSNLFGLNTDVTGVSSVNHLDFWLDGDRAKRWTFASDDRVLDLGGGVTVFKTEHSEDAFEIETLAGRVRLDVDLPQALATWFRLKRLTAGTQIERWHSRLAGESFGDSTTLRGGIQATWDASSVCNFDNVLFYYEREDLDDGPVADPALSRSGVHESVGVEVNLYYMSPGADRSYCRRPSIFRRYWPTGSTSLSVGYRNDHIDAVSEYAARWHRFYVASRLPINLKLALDMEVGVADVDYDEPSVFPSFVTREDTPRHFEGSLVRHFGHFDARVGYRWETNRAPDVPRYDFERNRFFFALNFERYFEKKLGLKDTGAEGSSSGSRGGGSGASDPVDPMPSGGG